MPGAQARSVRPGDAVSIVTYGVGVHWAMEEATYWAERGVEIEILDLRTLVPWDREAVMESVSRTHRVLVLHEAPRTGGFGGEIAAQVTETVFKQLDAPPIRLGGADLPIAFSSSIENEIYSARSRLRSGLKNLLEY